MVHSGNEILQVESHLFLEATELTVRQVLDFCRKKYKKHIKLYSVGYVD